MKKTNVKTIVIASLAIAIIFILTAFVVVPIGQFGYVNVGDSGIMLFASMLSAPFAFLCSAIGSALADIYLGYSQYALFTFIIKGLEGLCIALLFKKIKGKWQPLAYTVGMLCMVIGYYLSDVFLLQNAYAALGGVSFNLLQGATSVFIASVLHVMLYRHFQSSVQKKAI